MPDYKKAFAYGNYYDYQTGFEMTNIIMDTAEKANTDEEKEGCVQAFYFAAEEIQANVNISPLDAKNYMYLMRIYGALGKLGINPEENFKLAQEALDKGIALAPRRTEFYFSKSLIARDQGKYEEAIAAAQEAFKLSPTFGDSFWYLGLAYLDSGDKDKAKPLLKEALERGCGSDAVELISISQRFPLENNFDLLKLLYEKIVGLQPEDEQARLTLALIKKAGGDEDDYNKMKEELKAKGYEDKKFYAGVAICYVNLGATSEMEEAVRQAALAGLNLSFSENVIWRANLYIKLKRFDKAIAVYEEGIRNNPADPQLYASLAAVYKEMGNTLKAREVTLKILDLNPAYQEQVEEFLKILE